MMRLYEESRIFMNTQIKIKVNSRLGTVKTQNIIDDAFGKFSYVVKKFSRFDDKSELSLMNAQNGHKVTVSKEMFFLIQTSLKIAHLSNGVFDPTIIDILEAWGYDKNKDFSKLENLAKVQREISYILKNRPHWKDMLIDEKNLTITLMPNQRIDLGNIGKGYAIDLATEILRPAENFMIVAGGDLYAQGINQFGEKWKTGLTLPNKLDQIFGSVSLDHQSLASSGSWANSYKSFSHILNPKTGTPDQQIDQCFVIHDKAIYADGYSTMLALLGMEGLNILEKEKIGALIVVNDKLYSNNYFPEI